MHKISPSVFLHTADPRRAIQAWRKLIAENDYSGWTDAEIREAAQVLRDAADAAELLGDSNLAAACRDDWWRVVNP